MANLLHHQSCFVIHTNGRRTKVGWIKDQHMQIVHPYMGGSILISIYYKSIST
ncbi:hypothetical protein DEO72_LG2g3431 [Vigna unguiculata]|uniref:Uncharacterized protein n=1 Tax=Vigna unguiculata TaxID=3917 RepID=A0A4D6L3P2_VIGUN|nr:hypothetical protein DEO72_LG2g3431 [Vigna unguiculata]